MKRKEMEGLEEGETIYPLLAGRVETKEPFKVSRHSPGGVAIVSDFDLDHFDDEEIKKFVPYNRCGQWAKKPSY